MLNKCNELTVNQEFKIIDKSHFMYLFAYVYVYIYMSMGMYIYT